MINVSDNAKIGILLVSLGFLFMTLGVVLFLDAGLMTIGNLLLLVGFPFLIGWARTLVFFNPFRRRNKARGIVCFFLGILLVLFKWTLVGMVVEVAGMISMFAPFLSMVVTFLRALPGIGPLLNAPIVDRVVDKLAGVASKADSRRRPPV
jgi:hypothetical protein